MKKNFVFILILFFSNNLISQNLANHKKITAGLNNYVNFVNQTTHTLFVFYTDLSQFNASLIFKSKNPSISLEYKNRDYLNDNYFYFITPSEILHTCLNDSLNIKKSENDTLDKYLKNMYDILENLQKNSDSIEIYVNNFSLKNDSTYSKGFKLLKKSENLFALYEKKKKKFVYEIEKIYSKYKIKNSKNPFITTNNAFENLFITIYELSEALKKNQVLFIERKCKDLIKNIFDLNGKAGFYLKNTSYNKKRLYNIYDDIIFDAKLILKITKKFLKENKYPQGYNNILPKNYFYYNEKMLNYFNRQGFGMCYDFNLLADLSDSLILKKAQLSPFFVVLYPKKETYLLQNAPSNNLILLIDVSSSMKGENKLELIKIGLKNLISSIRDEDFVSIITYSKKANIIVENVSGKRKDTLYKLINSLELKSNTKLHRGLKKSYKICNRYYLWHGKNRIFLLTDGILSVKKRTKRMIKNNAYKISLSIFYLNKFDGKYPKINELSTLGNGNSIKVNKNNINSAFLDEILNY